MDVSKEYIKMCQQAKEIQENVNFTSGDFVHCIKNGKTVVLYFNAVNGSPPWYYTDIETSIFLPRQDQLQDMIYTSRKDAEGYEYGLLDLWESFQEFMNSDYPDDHFMNVINYMDSFEQAWLLFIMLIKYNKIWNNQDWVSA